MLELPNKSEKIQQFAWEPRGSRFALLHGDGSRPTGEAGLGCVCTAGWLLTVADGPAEWRVKECSAARSSLPQPGPPSDPQCSSISARGRHRADPHVQNHSHAQPLPQRSAAVSIYNMKDNKSSARGVTLLHTMTNKQCTSLHWSPSGRFLLLAGLGVRPAAAMPAHCCALAVLVVVDTVRCLVLQMGECMPPHCALRASRCC